MKELWMTGSSWEADRCWCWRIERVIIQSFGYELVLVLAGSPGSQITPNQASIDHMRTYPGTVWKQFHWAKVVMLIKECHQWPQDQCTWNWRSKLRCELLLASYFLWRAFRFYFIHILRCNTYFFGLVSFDWIENIKHIAELVMIGWYLLSNVSN